GLPIRRPAPPASKNPVTAVDNLGIAQVYGPGASGTSSSRGGCWTDRGRIIPQGFSTKPIDLCGSGIGVSSDLVLPLFFQLEVAQGALSQKSRRSNPEP